MEAGYCTVETFTAQRCNDEYLLFKLTHLFYKQTWETEIISHSQERSKEIIIHINCSGDTTPFDDAPVIRTEIIRCFVNSGKLKPTYLSATDEPVYLTGDKVDWLAGVVNGYYEYELPLIFVSKIFNSSGYEIDIDSLARKLAGVAYVLAEADDNFVGTLKEKTYARNPYNGHLGVYYLLRHPPHHGHPRAADGGDLRRAVRLQIYRLRTLCRSVSAGGAKARARAAYVRRSARGPLYQRPFDGGARALRRSRFRQVRHAHRPRNEAQPLRQGQVPSAPCLRTGGLAAAGHSHAREGGVFGCGGSLHGGRSEGVCRGRLRRRLAGEGAQAMLEFEPDWIVAMGGGSPIDAAKAMWIKYEYPDITFEEMCKVFGIPQLRHKAKFCAISSTSGTATEVTAFSIITDYAKGIKYPIADFEITPDVAIVDPELAETMPKKLVAHTGMDAMTHAIEAYVSTANRNYTDPLAIHAIEMIQKDLVASYNGDMAARDAMHDAQCLAGMAFSNALLGIVHSMAHKTGAAFADYGAHIIHGAANAMYLPKVIAFNAKNLTARRRYGVIADYMGICNKSASDSEKVRALIAYLRKMNDDLNIPHCIKNYGADSYPCEQGFVPENVFLERLHDIAVNAIGDACTGSNPRKPTVEEMEKLLKCCYYDTEVDF